MVSVLLIGATLSPVLRDPFRDGFPLSTYPMFATRREVKQTVTYPLGETAAGGRRMLRPELVGTGEILQALRVIDRAIAANRLTMLCDAIAARVAADEEFADVVVVRIVTGTHDAVEYLARDRLGPERERVRCQVKR